MNTLLGLVIVLTISSTYAAEVHVAVAANFAQPMEQLKQLFEKTHDHQVIVTLGSTGKLYSQIKNGAPFEVFLAADLERTLKLSQEGETVKGSIFTYAIGKLVLWSHDPTLVDNAGQILNSDKFTHLAIADPKTAPYGTAARQVLEKLGLWQTLSGKIVQGTDISQTYQFVATGNAELGFIAFSQYLSTHEKGSYWLVPQDLYSPLLQGAVLLKKGENNLAATTFWKFLQSQAASEVTKNFGYGVRGQ